MSYTVESLALLFVAGLVCSLVFTGMARGLGRRVGLVDLPDGRRKIHTRIVPLVGGIAVFFSMVLVLSIAFSRPGSLADDVSEQSREVLGLLGAATLICAVGVLDDSRGLRGRYKLLGQFAAIGILLATGVQVRAVALFGVDIELGWIGLPLTAFWLLGAINSLNLLDGMDGLLGTVGTIICLAVAGMAAMNQHMVGACIAIVLAGSLVGFLRYNLPPASVFLGDAGSMLVGLVIGVLAIQCSLKGPATVALAAPFALMTLPIFDSTAAVLRRKLTGRSIFSTDRGHLHHCMLRCGLSRPRILLIVSALCALTVVGVLGSIAIRSESLAILSAAAVVVILIATRLFGHAEFVLLTKSLKEYVRASAGFGRAGRELEVRLQGSAGWSVMWTSIVSHAEQLNLRSVALDVNAPAHHEGYHARWSGPAAVRSDETVECWSAVILLTAWGQTIGQVAVSGHPDSDPVWRKLSVLASVTDGVETVLAGTAPAVPVLTGHGPLVASSTA